MTAAPRRALPPQGSIDLWWLGGAADDEALAAVPLDPAEEARAARMATPALRARTIRRRRFLRAVLAAYLDTPPAAVPLATLPGGKPVLEGAPGRFSFNLSHTGETSVLAVGRDDLGIDVERRKAFDRLFDVVAFSCSPRERRAIAAAADPTAAFLDRWVIKEAILKGRGTGLVEDLPGVDPGPLDGDPIRSDGLTILRLDPPPAVSAPDAAAPLHAALAVDGPVTGVTWLTVGDLPAGA